MRRFGFAIVAGIALCACSSFVAQEKHAMPTTRLERLQERRTLLLADLLDAKTSHDSAKQDFADQLLDDCDMEIALLGGPVSERVPLVSEPKTAPHTGFSNAAFTEGRQIVVRVPSAVIQRAKDEAALANMLDSDVEDSQVGRGMVDYRKRIAILRMMEKVRKEYVDEAKRMN